MRRPEGVPPRLAPRESRMARRPPEHEIGSRRHAAMRAAARGQFDQWAHSYDRSWLNPVVFFPTIRLCVEEIARWRTQRADRADFRMLDVGCGTGTLLGVVERRLDADLLVGLDYSPVMVRRLAEKIAAAGGPSRLHAVQGDAEHLPFRSGAFDVVTCCNSLHHYPHQAAVIREFRRVLRPGGLLVIVDGFRDNVIGWIVFDVAVALIERNVHHASWSHLRAMIEDAGFSTLRQRKVNVLAPLLASVAIA